jgi:hypothetical protein
MGGDLVDSVCSQPVHEREGSLAGISQPLPRHADHPRDISNASGVGRRRDGGLHCADSCPVVGQPDDPVEPDVPAVRRSRDEPAVSIPEFDERVRATAGERMQALVIEHIDHFIGVLNGQSGQVQTLGNDGLAIALEGSHAPPLRSGRATRPGVISVRPSDAVPPSKAASGHWVEVSRCLSARVKLRGREHIRAPEEEPETRSSGEIRPYRGTPSRPWLRGVSGLR